MERKKGQGVPTVLTKQDAKVQRQLRALQKRVLAIEYFMGEIQQKSEVRQIGFIQQFNLKSDNKFDNE